MQLHTHNNSLSVLTTFMKKKHCVAVEKYFLFIQYIFSSQLYNRVFPKILD